MSRFVNGCAVVACGLAGGIGAASAAVVTVDYTSVASGTYATVGLGGTTVSGSSAIGSGAVAGFRGLGVVGGGSDLTIDLGESLTIDFGTLASNAKVTLVDVAPVGNVVFGFRLFQGLTDLGLFGGLTASTAPQTFDLDALSGGLDVTSLRIQLTTSAPLGLQLQAVAFEPAAASVPAAGTAALLGLGLVPLLGLGRRARRS